EDAIDREANQLGGDLQEGLRVAFREPALEDEVLPFAIPTLPQPVQERIPSGGGWGSHVQKAEPVDFPRRLRLGSERRYEHTQDACDDEPDDSAPHGCLLMSTSCQPSSIWNEAET